MLSLSVKNLQCERHHRLLFSQLSFSIQAGTMVRIHGKNGAGKTTLLHLIAGIHRSFKGDIVSSPEITHISPPLFIGHQLGIKSLLTPYENLHYWLSLYHFSDHKKNILQALTKVGLSQDFDTYCYHLSAGQHQRIALAKLWLNDCWLWILDEPFTALDQHIMPVIAEKMLYHIHHQGAILFTSHHMPSTLQSCPIKEICLDHNQAPDNGQGT